MHGLQIALVLRNAGARKSAWTTNAHLCKVAIDWCSMSVWRVLQAVLLKGFQPATQP